MCYVCVCLCVSFVLVYVHVHVYMHVFVFAHVCTMLKHKRRRTVYLSLSFVMCQRWNFQWDSWLVRFWLGPRAEGRGAGPAGSEGGPGNKACWVEAGEGEM